MSIKPALKPDTKLAQTSALALATGLMFAATPAHAQSFEGSGVVVEGAATINTGPGTTDVTVESNSAVIDWTPTDNQGVGDILFQQAGTTATFTNDPTLTDFAVLNRILPADPGRRVIFDGTVISQLQDGAGNVSAGGTVFFYTPGGIVIGSNAVFDVGNLGLTTAAPVTDGAGNFIDANGRVQFQQADPNSEIFINNGAFIGALEESSYVAAFAPNIVHFGDIRVNGQAALVAGEAGSITFSPDGLFDIQVDIGSDSGTGVQISGAITGPTSSGAGDNHRIYLVAVPKNTAITMAIAGGSDLGFDVAQSATVENGVIVLSAGYNITVGDIDTSTAPSPFDASIIVDDFDLGLGPDIFFSSNVEAWATHSTNIFINSLIAFGGNARFTAGEVSTQINSGGSLDVIGDFILRSRNGFFGDDVGPANFQVFNGSATIGGNLRVASEAREDFNEDGLLLSGNALVNVSGATSTLDVGGNLLVRTQADLPSILMPFAKQTGFANLNIANGGSVTVGGLTAISSNTGNQSGGDATAGVASLDIFSGGSLLTSELAVSSVASVNVTNALVAGNASSLGASIGIVDANSSLVVQNANTTAVEGAVPALLASEAYGGEGVNANGGSASTSYVQFSVLNGATIDLPDDPLLPLEIRNIAVGGSTSEDDGTAGTAFTGQLTIDINGSIANLGRLAIISDTIGGSALATAERTRGGDSFGSSAFIAFNNSNVDVAFDSITVRSIGGNGSDDVGGDGGTANAGNVSLPITNSTVNVNSDLVLDLISVGGNGNIGGDATAHSSNPDIIDSMLNVAGDLRLSQLSLGGNGITQGGNAFSQFSGILFRNSDVTATGGGSVTGNSLGGTTESGQGGNATSDSPVINFDGLTNLDAAFVRVSSTALGGAVNGAGAVGNGGSANVLGARVDLPNFGSQGILATTINADVEISTSATGGSAGAGGGDGGAATAGLTRLFFDQPSDFVLNGNVFVRSEATGGAAAAGTGGTALGADTQIFTFANNSNVDINGNAEIAAFATGGAGLVGGDASGLFSTLFIDGSTADISGLTRIVSQVEGGAGLNGGVGGLATGAQASVIGDNNEGGSDSNVTLADLVIEVNSFGGAGGDATVGDGGAGGDAIGGQAFIFGRALNGNVTVTGSTTINLDTVGGDGGAGVNGGAGGAATGGGAQFGTASGQSLPVQPINGSATFTTIDVALTNVGGNGGAATTGTGGAGGAAGDSFATLLTRGAPVTATDVTLTSLAVGGDGGAGATQGDGGDATTGQLNVAVSEAFNNPGRGAMNLSSVVLDTAALGGAGLTPGDSLWTGFGGFTLRQSDVSIGSVDITITADSPVLEPGAYAVAFNGGTIFDVDTFTLVTPSDVIFDSVASGTVGRIIDITARSFVPVDPAMPNADPGIIEATELLSLTSTEGDITIETVLQADAQVLLTSAGAIRTTDIFGGDITLRALGGTLETGLLDAGANTVTLESFDTLTLPGLTAGSLVARSINGTINTGGTLTISGLADLEALDTIALGDIDAGAILVTSNQGGITANTLTANDITLRALGGNINAQFLDATNGTLTLETPNVLFLPSFSATNLVARGAAVGSLSPVSVTGDFVIESTGGNAIFDDIDAASVTITVGTGMVLGNVNAETITLLAGQSGVNTVAVETGVLNAGPTGVVTVENLGNITLGGVEALDLTAVSIDGTIDTTGAPIIVGGNVTIDANLDALLGDIDADRLFVDAGALANFAGQVNTTTVDLASANLDFDTDGAINADAIAINSTNLAGTLIVDTDPETFAGNVIDAFVYERLNAADVAISAVGANGGTRSLTVGNFDLSANPQIARLTLATSSGGSVLVNGQVTASGTGPIDLTLTSGTITIDTATGGIDLFDNGGLLSLFANAILIGEASLFDGLTGEETDEELAALINAPATNARPDGTLRAGEIFIGATDRVLIQNSGTEEVPAGFFISDTDFLTIEPGETGGLLVIISGQIAGVTGTPVVGDDAATAILDNADDLTIFDSGSQLNGCAIGGCVVASGEGELTAIVSAAVSGAVSTAGATTGTGSTTSGSASGSGGSNGSGETGETSATATSTATAGTSAGSSNTGGSGEVTAENVDDGGGEDEFLIEEDDTSTEETEGEEEAEEEETSEEEEEAEAAATGPIAPPVTIFNTSGLDRPVNINDPISGSGNPALTDPEVDTPPSGNDGDQQ